MYRGCRWGPHGSRHRIAWALFRRSNGYGYLDGEGEQDDGSTVPGARARDARGERKTWQPLECEISVPHPFGYQLGLAWRKSVQV